MLRFWILNFTLVLVVSCASTPTTSPSKDPIRQPTKAIDANSIFELIAAAERAEPQRANGLRIQAAELAIGSNNVDQTINILDSIEQPLAIDLERHFSLLNAQIAIATEDGPTALDWLKRANRSGNLSQSEQLQLGQLRARAYYAGRSFLASARERIFFNPLLSNSQKIANQEKLFSTLLELPQQTLVAQANKAITSELRGWLSLAALTKQYQDSPMRQLQALQQWQRVWSSHEAAINLPSSLASLSTVVENQAKVIALFLPLQGDLSAFGRAIRDAIISSRLQLGRDVDIQVYDTSNTSIEQLVTIAKNSGAELGIGPLQRDKVTELSKIKNLPIPILALNRTLEGHSNPNLYQFALAPEDEMIQVADQVFREGKRNALIIYPSNDWGERNVTAFEERWRSLGGNIINQSSYADQKDYSTLVKTLLDVDQSEDRASNLRRIIGQGFEFTPRRRQDIDFVFLLANQNQARGINPTLAFYYAEDIPVYSTSHIYEYDDTKIESIDLNGIRFCDIHWKLSESSTMQQDFKALWPQSKSSLAPFYALGVDAFNVYPRLQQLKDVPSEKIFGETGTLSLNQENVILRTLAWAQFSNGSVVPAPQVINN